MTAPLKSEGFLASIILPAMMCPAKLHKKLIKALPKGTSVELTLTKATLNKGNISDE